MREKENREERLFNLIFSIYVYKWKLSERRRRRFRWIQVEPNVLLLLLFFYFFFFFIFFRSKHFKLWDIHGNMTLRCKIVSFFSMQNSCSFNCNFMHRLANWEIFFSILTCTRHFWMLLNILRQYFQYFFFSVSHLPLDQQVILVTAFRE